MSGLPQFSLRWNQYVQHVTDAFQALRTQDDLVDVTLCCEGRKIKAHKVLLSACSAYFKDIFRENPCRHPVVIFRNVKYDDLNAIINFIYTGEVSILQEQLDSFLMTAELLEVKGLTDCSEEDEDNRNGNPISTGLPNFDLDGSQKTTVELSEVQLLNEEPINLATSQAITPKDFYLPNTSSAADTPNQRSSTQYDNIIKEDTGGQSESAVVKSSVTVTQITGEEMQVDNQNSDNTDESSDRNNGNETDLAKFRCQLCPKGFKHPTSLTLHRDSHTGKTQCPVCHRSFSRSYDMRSHLQKIHQGKHLTIKEIRYKVSNDTLAPKTFTHHI